MTQNPKVQFSDVELDRVLHDLEQLDASRIVPLSEEEVAEIEAAYQPGEFDPARDARQRQAFEALRQEWLANTERLTSLLTRIRALGLGRDAFVERMRIDLALLLKLERRLVVDIPHRFMKKLADELQVGVASVYTYLTQPPKELAQMAASSKGKPSVGAVETWTDAVAKSHMREEDKAYWLSPPR